MNKPGTLIFFCGKMGAGKSTRAIVEASARNAVLLSEDEWLQSLYPDEIRSISDYLTYSGRIKPVVENTVTGILSAGASVVMDFPANTKKQRQWFLSLARRAGSHHILFYLDVDDEQCLRQISQRRTEQPERAAFDTESTFWEMAKYFQQPELSESLTIERVNGKTG